MSISWEIIAPLVGLQFILMVFALVSCLKEEELNGPKWMWMVAIVGMSIIGPVLYFVIGRKNI